MSWRDTKIDGDIILASDHNSMAIYTMGHQLQHQLNGEQSVDHNLLLNYDQTKHRKITPNDALGIITIET